MVSILNPSGLRRSMSIAWQPSSLGVIDFLSINAFASAKVLLINIFFEINFHHNQALRLNHFLLLMVFS